MVISVIVLLMALLVPALSRARKQARAVACQAKLRQWGLVFKTYLDDSDGQFWDSDPRHEWLRKVEPYWQDYPDLGLCPVVVRYNRENRAFSTWHLVFYKSIDMSYGLNGWADYPVDSFLPERHWRTCGVRGAATIPLFSDSTWVESNPSE